MGQFANSACLVFSFNPDTHSVKEPLPLVLWMRQAKVFSEVNHLPIWPSHMVGVCLTPKACSHVRRPPEWVRGLCSDTARTGTVTDTARTGTVTVYSRDSKPSVKQFSVVTRDRSSLTGLCYPSFLDHTQKKASGSWDS